MPDKESPVAQVQEVRIKTMCVPNDQKGSLKWSFGNWEKGEEDQVMKSKATKM